MKKNWQGPLGPVSLKSNFGEVVNFETFEEAVAYIRDRRPLIYDHPARSVSIDGLYCNRTCMFETRYNLLDECGIIIPTWKIEEAATALPPRDTPIWISRRYSGYDPDTHFRKAAVPGTGKSRRRFGRVFRHVKTRQEIRENAGLDADFRELEDFPMRVKIRGRRKDLPTLWDDIVHFEDARSWKSYRKKQYRE